MKNTELACNVYGRWEAGDVAYVSGLNWVSGGNAGLTITALAQPRLQQTYSWPNAEGPWYRVVMQFEGVHNLKLQQFGSGPRQIMGFSIEKISERGLENLNYHIEDYESGVLEFYARTASLLSVEAVPSPSHNP